MTKKTAAEEETVIGKKEKVEMTEEGEAVKEEAVEKEAVEKAVEKGTSAACARRRRSHGSRHTATVREYTTCESELFDLVLRDTILDHLLNDRSGGHPERLHLEVFAHFVVVLQLLLGLFGEVPSALFLGHPTTWDRRVRTFGNTRWGVVPAWHGHPTTELCRHRIHCLLVNVVHFHFVQHRG
jgi:hypothetical protein